MVVSGDVEIENDKKKGKMNPLCLGKENMKRDESVNQNGYTL